MFLVLCDNNSWRILLGLRDEETKKLRDFILPVINGLSYRYPTVDGFPSSKSLKPKSVVVNELVLNTFLPYAGIIG
jgi:hypothetical protein